MHTYKSVCICVCVASIFKYQRTPLRKVLLAKIYKTANGKNASKKTTS